jgi:Tol biopolymer transport system component
MKWSGGIRGKNPLSVFVLTLLLLFTFLPSCSPSAASVQILPALKQANLQGRMIFILYNLKGNQLVRLDLTSGTLRTLFAAPERSWLGAAELSPDGTQIVLAYAPPPPKGQVQLADTDLYRMPADGSSEPQPLLQRSRPNESFTYPSWSPDGQMIYYTHTLPSTSNRLGVDSTIERARLNGIAEVILKNAIWPRLSPDGARMAYLVLSEFTSNNALSLAGADGSHPTQLVSAKTFPIVDAHIFSPDGKEVYFSAPSPLALWPVEPAAATTRGWFFEAHQLLTNLWHLGVQPVSAHSNPSDWFRVSVDGGEPQQVTHVQDVNMVAAFSPDEQWLAFISQKGLFLMKPDGSQLTQLAVLPGMGSLNWVK